MSKSTNRSIPLTAAMARLIDVADLIRSRATADEALRDLCEDYRLARKVLARMKTERPRPSQQISEYASLVKDLEDEIMTYLLSPESDPAGERHLDGS